MKQLTALGYAVMALRGFQRRWEKRPRFKHPSIEFNRRQMVTDRVSRTREARRYIHIARSMGWRGSVVEACMRGEAITREGAL